MRRVSPRRAASQRDGPRLNRQPWGLHLPGLALTCSAVAERKLSILGVGDGRSINFLRWGRRLAERGHEVHIVSDRITDRRRDLEGITASGPPLGVLIHALEKLRDQRMAADRSDIPTRFHDLATLRSLINPP